MSYTTEQLQERFNQLPIPVKDYLLDDEVEQSLETLTDWFEIDKEEEFRKAVMALGVGLAKSEEFITFAENDLGVSEEEADVLFDEVGERILAHVHELFDESVGGTTTATPQAPRAVGDVKKFIGIPAYGVEKPASSYTSVLPRSDVALNKFKDTPTADSFIQKLNTLNTQNVASAAKTAPAPTNLPTGSLTTSSSVSPTSAASPAPVPAAPSNTSSTPPGLPALEKDVPSLELAKLARPINIPRKETTMETGISAPKAPTPMPTPTAVPQNKPVNPPQNQPSKPYSLGSDPYRESPTP